MTRRRGRPLLRTGMVGGTDQAPKKLEQGRRQYEEAAVAAPAVAPAAAPLAPAGGLSDAQFVGS